MENNQTERVADASKTMSSIEWLLAELSYDNGFGVRHPTHNEMVDLSDYFNQAKKIHMQEIIDAYIEGFSATEHNVGSEHYYQNTFNPQNNGKV